MVNLSRSEPGKTHLGCLFTLFVLAAAVYVGIGAGETYWRYYRLKDFVQQQADLGTLEADDVLLQKLIAYGDSNGLTLGKKDWNIRRGGSPRQISISAHYQDSVVIALLSFRKVYPIMFYPSGKAKLQ